jgi:hypothetical protein
VRLKSAEAWGCPCSVKYLFKDIRSALTPSSPCSILSLFLLVVLEISIQIQMRSYNKIDLPHSTPFLCGGGGWIAVYRVDSEIKWVIVKLRRRVPYTMFFLWIQSLSANTDKTFDHPTLILCSPSSENHRSEWCVKTHLGICVWGGGVQGRRAALDWSFIFNYFPMSRFFAASYLQKIKDPLRDRTRRKG